MWRALLSNFHEIVSAHHLSTAATSSSLLPTRKQHNAVALALSDPVCSGHVHAAREHVLSLPWNLALKQLAYPTTATADTATLPTALASFLVGSIILNECGCRRWESALRVYSAVLDNEPWSMRENFARRVAVAVPGFEQRLVVARAFVEAERRRVAAEAAAEGADAQQQQTQISVSPSAVLSPAFRQCLMQAISMSRKRSMKQQQQQQSESQNLWRETLEFLTEAPCVESNFPTLPSELSNYLVAVARCDKSSGMWVDALRQIEKHAVRILSPSSSLSKAPVSKKDDVDPGAVPRLFALQWICASYGAVPPALRPESLPPVVEQLSRELITADLFDANRRRRSNENDKSYSISGHSSNLAQTATNLVLMSQRTCSWRGAIDVLDRFFRVAPRHFEPCLLHYNTCLDEHAGWAATLAVHARMRSQLGPTNSTRWMRYAESYDTRFAKFLNRRDPTQQQNGERPSGLLDAHYHHMMLRTGRSMTREPTPPIEIWNAFLESAPESLNEMRFSK